MTGDYYQLLEVTPTASPEEIKLAYHRLARQYHPDLAGSEAKQKFQAINEAYQVLSDPVRRSQFDQTRPSPRPTPGQVVFRTRPTEPEPTPHAALQEIRVLLKKNQLVRAIEQAEQLALKFPGQPEVRHILALAYQRWGNALIYRGDHRQAARYLDKAEATDPKDSLLRFEIARDRSRLKL